LALLLLLLLALLLGAHEGPASHPPLPQELRVLLLQQTPQAPLLALLARVVRWLALQGAAAAAAAAAAPLQAQNRACHCQTPLLPHPV
jgi:hypothetical protein